MRNRGARATAAAVTRIRGLGAGYLAAGCCCSKLKKKIGEENQNISGLESQGMIDEEERANRLTASPGLISTRPGREYETSGEVTGRKIIRLVEETERLKERGQNDDASEHCMYYILLRRSEF